MQPHKSFITQLGELIDQHRAEQPTAPARPGRVRRLIRWLTPNGGTLLLIALLIATQGVWARNLQSPAAPGPSATTVNYQGRLADSGGTPINSSRAMTFAIYDAATGGNLIWGPETHAAIPVSNGLFSVGLGSVLSIPTTTWNGDRYLEITVGGETLSPRELIRSVPIAGLALTVPDGSITRASIANNALPVFTASTTTAYWPVPKCDFTGYPIPGLSISVSVDRTSSFLVDVAGMGHSGVATGAIYSTISVDGQTVMASSGEPILGGCRNSSGDTGGLAWCSLANSAALTLSPGSHTIDVRAQCDGGPDVIAASGGSVHAGGLRVVQLP